MLVVHDVLVGVGGERGFAGTAQTEQQQRTTGYIFAMLRFGALLENVALEDDRAVDCRHQHHREHPRRLPLSLILHARIPCLAGYPTDIVFQTSDAFGVLPPVGSLTTAHATLLSRVRD